MGAGAMHLQALGWPSVQSSSAAYEYNTDQIGSEQVSGVQAAYESIGTYIGSYTPDVFKVKELSLGFGRSDSDVGFTVFDGSDDRYFNLRNPVYVAKRIRWEPGLYDLIQLRIPMDVYEDTLIDDSEPKGNDIQVTIPGYTDEHIYAFQSEVSEAHSDLAGTSQDIELIPYLGNNRFQLPRLLSTARQLVGTYSDEHGGQMSTTFPTETMMFRTGIAASTVYSDMAGSVTEESYLEGNAHLENSSFGVWADIPFEGFTIREDTEVLKVTFFFDTEDLFELWEMNQEFLDNGGGGLSARYRILLAADFYERITVKVEQYP